MALIKILFVADTHLGLDFPFKPRIERRRRGPDFFDNFNRALKPAIHGEVDCVIHGGDLLYRSRVPAQLVDMALSPLKKVADRGIPVFIVPGNHERSTIPHGLLATYPLIHIFHRPQTYLLQKKSYTLGLAGFPHIRHGIRQKFPEVLKQTGWEHKRHETQGFLLCLHQCCEGATVGTADYTFRYNHDVIRLHDIPEGFAAVLAGHIHRHQILNKDLAGNPMRTPVLYPGSIERTSIAERKETKGYLTLELDLKEHKAALLKRYRFHELPARPMFKIELHAEKMSGQMLRNFLLARLGEYPVDSVVKIDMRGTPTQDQLNVLSAASIRAIAPETMNVYVRIPTFMQFQRR